MSDLTPVVFFTGAGISVAAGLPTYRGAGGLYEGSDREPPNARDATEARIGELWERFTGRLVANRTVRPTRAHVAIARIQDLEATSIDPTVRETMAVTVITQNVDGLHIEAGSREVIELHGSLRRMRCLHCGERAGVPDPSGWVMGVPRCPTCQGPARPDIVLFGEQLPPDAMERGYAAIAQARTVVAVGTSGSVWPAARLIASDVTEHAARIWINPEPPPGPEWSWLAGDADSGVEALLSGEARASTP